MAGDAIEQLLIKNHSKRTASMLLVINQSLKLFEKLEGSFEANGSRLDVVLTCRLSHDRANEIVGVVVALRTVKSLRFGRSAAKESDPVLPVPDEDIKAVLPRLTSPVRAMVRLQLLTGMRPGEVLNMTAGIIDTSGEVWLYRPETHKNAWRGKQRTILIGPRGQDVLLPFLVGRLAEEYLFNPHDGRKEFIEANYRDDARSQVRGSKEGENNPYTIHGYTSSIQRACKRSGVPKWSPGRLRHNAATNINKEFGDIDASRVVLGHSEKSTTEIYAERDFQKAAEIIRRIG